MKRKTFKFSLLACIGTFAFGVVALSGCSSNTSFVAATVRLNKTELNLVVGQTEKLTASVSKGYDGAELRWFSSNENVAYVESGYVHGVGEGPATITASYGGGFAECTVNVSEDGGGAETPRLVLNATSKKLTVGSSFALTYTIYPDDATVAFSTSDEKVATVSDGGIVEAIALGVATITATGSNGKVAACSITVADEVGPDTPSTDLDIGVPTNLNDSGEFKIGVPPGQETFTQTLLAEFNVLTSSNIKYSVITFSEDKAADNMSDATTGPDVFPYASDQTLRLYARQILSFLGNDDADWIENTMGSEATDYATLAGVNRVVGYPFAGDNSYVMFYDKTLVGTTNMYDVTIDELFDLADAKTYEINYDLTNGFYAAGALMTYSGGKSLYTITARDNGSYTSSGKFSNGDTGVKGAQLMRKIFGEAALMGAAEVPGERTEVLATITDCSKVEAFKGQMNDKYAAAPLPWTDSNKTTRIGSYLGYKFFGINGYGRSAAQVATANHIAKFLASEYVQAKRFEKFYTKPTIKSLQSDEAVLAEPHIAAINAQIAAKATIPLTAVGSELWSETMSSAKLIKDLPANAEAAQYKSILEQLDDSLTK